MEEKTEPLTVNFDESISSLADAMGQSFVSLVDAFTAISDIMDFRMAIDNLPDDGSREEGFICVHPGTDTWAVKALYERRRQEREKMVRQKQYIPPRPIRKGEIYQQRRSVSG